MKLETSQTLLAFALFGCWTFFDPFALAHPLNHLFARSLTIVLVRAPTLTYGHIHSHSLLLTQALTYSTHLFLHAHLHMRARLPIRVHTRPPIHTHALSMPMHTRRAHPNSLTGLLVYLLLCTLAQSPTESDAAMGPHACDGQKLALRSHP